MTDDISKKYIRSKYLHKTREEINRYKKKKKNIRISPFHQKNFEIIIDFGIANDFFQEYLLASELIIDKHKKSLYLFITSMSLVPNFVKHLCKREREKETDAKIFIFISRLIDNIVYFNYFS